MAKPDAEPAYPIRTVGELTGVNPVTLRAWERRYGLLAPLRSEGGQRLYSQGDVDLVHRVKALVQGGMAVAQACELARRHVPAERRRAAGPWQRWHDEVVAAVEQFDEARLERAYAEMLALYPIERVTREALLPVLATLGQRWQDRPGGIAEEHFFGVYLRNKLGARFHHRSGEATGPRLVLACLPGEQHEVGLLLFALAAHERRFRIVMLGAGMPLAETGYAARRCRAEAIVLSASLPGDAEALAQPLAELVTGAGVPVFVGGPVSVAERDRIAAAGGHALGTDFGAALDRIAALLRPEGDPLRMTPPDDPPRPARGHAT